MKYRRYKDSKYEDSGITCGRCGGIIYEEVMFTGSRTGLYSCSRDGCTWPDYHLERSHPWYIGPNGLIDIR